VLWFDFETELRIQLVIGRVLPLGLQRDGLELTSEVKAVRDIHLLGCGLVLEGPASPIV
jgi:hypothetical protein